MGILEKVVENPLSYMERYLKQVFPAEHNSIIYSLSHIFYKETIHGIYMV